jgi:hypothetical protein
MGITAMEITAMGITHINNSYGNTSYGYNQEYIIVLFTPDITDMDITVM